MAGITTSILGTGLGAYKLIDGAKRSRDAQRDLDNYQRQDLNNAYKEIGISTAGSDLLQEENARTSANLVNALQMGGTRSVFGGIPKVVSATNDVNQQAAKMLESQYINRDYAIAGDNARIEGMIENRDNQNIAALSSQANAGRQDMWDGIQGVASGINYGARNIDFTGEGSWQDQQTEKMIQAMNRYSMPGSFSTPYNIPVPVPYNSATPLGPSQYPQPYFDFPNS